MILYDRDSVGAFAILEKRKKRLDECGGGMETRLDETFRNPRAQ